MAETIEKPQALRWCSRCHCSVPLDEWRVTPSGLKHVGPMRDHDAEVYVEPDENGNVECGFWESRPNA